MKAPYQSCPEWRCSPWLRCSNRRYRPSSAVSWARERTRCRYHGEQEWDAPGLNHSDRSPERIHVQPLKTHPNGVKPCTKPPANTHFARHGVRLSDLVTPVSSSDGNDGQFGQDDGTTDSGRYLFGALHSQTNMAIVVTNSNKGLEDWEIWTIMNYV